MKSRKILSATLFKGETLMKHSISERRGTREECREKRDGAVSDGRDGREKGQAHSNSASTSPVLDYKNVTTKPHQQQTDRSLTRTFVR